MTTNTNDAIKAICVLTHTASVGVSKKIKGVIRFEEDLESKEVIIRVNVEGLKPGYHGFHIHQAGDLTDGCTSGCSHFNPFNKKHGGPQDKERHVGDLGNIHADKNGVARNLIRDKLIRLRGKYSILGRMVVIHKDPDDLGRGGLSDDGVTVTNQKKNKESLRTGNAGDRIACGVIGYSKECF